MSSRKAFILSYFSSTMCKFYNLPLLLKEIHLEIISKYFWLLIKISGTIENLFRIKVSSRCNLKVGDTLVLLLKEMEEDSRSHFIRQHNTQCVSALLVLSKSWVIKLLANLTKILEIGTLIFPLIDLERYILGNIWKPKLPWKERGIQGKKNVFANIFW